MPTETKSETATERPWRYSASTRTIYGGRGFTIANIPNSSETGCADVEIEANIELLIKAVNEHAALIAVSEAARQVNGVLKQIVFLANVNDETRRMLTECGNALGKTLVELARLRAK